MASREPTTLRAAIYTHFETTEAGNVVCNHCHNVFKSSGGTSNLHKHLIAAHPKVDRRAIYLPEYCKDSLIYDQRNLPSNRIVFYPNPPCNNPLIHRFIFSVCSTDDEEQQTTGSQTTERQSLSMNESAIKTGEILLKQVRQLRSHYFYI